MSDYGTPGANALHVAVADPLQWLGKVRDYAADHGSVLVLGAAASEGSLREAVTGLSRENASIVVVEDTGLGEFPSMRHEQTHQLLPSAIAVSPPVDGDEYESLLTRAVEAMPPGSDLLYVGRRAPFVAVVALHKSGTHLVGRFMEAAGYRPFGIGIQKGPTPDGHPDWISWEDAEFDGLAENTAYFSHTLPFMALRKPGEQYRTLLKRWLSGDFPLLFHYRDPRAVVSAVMRYCMNRVTGKASLHGAWIQILGAVLEGLPDDDARLTATLELMGDYMQRQYRENLWMLWHPRVIRSSYETLAGTRAGGSEAAQLKCVAQTMVRLGITGSPASLASSLFSENVRTFSRGRIDGWQEDFKDHHLELFERRFGDLRELYGY